jgi:capping protein alpha
VERIDIKSLTIDSPTLIKQLGPAFEKYNEEQFATVKLPGSSQNVGLPLLLQI